MVSCVEDQIITTVLIIKGAVPFANIDQQIASGAICAVCKVTEFDGLHYRPVTCVSCVLRRKDQGMKPLYPTAWLEEKIK